MSVFDHYEPVIGLEVHCQLSTRSKLFCGCEISFGDEANRRTCPVCLGLPGALPVLNASAVDLALKMAIAVSGHVNERSSFARKQYFYPDLPKGYQISQFETPYCSGGHLITSDGARVRLNRIHLEEDAGKNIHGQGSSFVDLNRAGTPLIEIVSEPDIHSSEQASDYLKQLRTMVRHLQISDGNLEEGSFRCDANVSVRKRGEEKLGTRVEVKNLNSFRNIEKAISYEILRQIDCIEEGSSVHQETRLYDPASGKTRSMRSKEDSPDYRYFDDPDLPAIVVSEERLEAIRETMPPLPSELKEKWEREYGLSSENCATILADYDCSRYFIEVVEIGSNPIMTCNWMLTEVGYHLANSEKDWSNCPIKPYDFSVFLEQITSGVISGKIGKKIIAKMFATGSGALEIIKADGLQQNSDAGEIDRIVDEVIAANAAQLEEYRAGKDKVFGFFVGQVMRKGGGRLNPQLVNEALVRKLSK